jgi:MFS superfamily sulfate permease-like transporter
VALPGNGGHRDDLAAIAPGVRFDMSHPSTAPTTPNEPVPVGNLAGLAKYFGKDLLSGFLVFLIALPLCLAISKASGYPAIAGVFTAIIGGIFGCLLSNSELTIKGPAAGLIVIAVGCVNFFESQVDASNVPLYTHERAYQLALGVGVVAAAIQILFALSRTGIVGQFFPISAVHGMLASIGLIIILKSIMPALGTSYVLPKGHNGPIDIFLSLPQIFQALNPDVALIGLISLTILFGLPLIKNQYVKMIPAQFVVVLVAVPLGIYLNLEHKHTYSLFGNDYTVGEESLVTVPSNMFEAIRLPDFSGLALLGAWQFVAMYAIIGTLESMLSARAVDLLDPWKRRTNLDRDNLSVGVGNLVAAFVGGLPMISEIVRSRANIDNGARTRFANFFHAIFLLVCVATIPMYIHRIPEAALYAMLIYTGFRLAHPKEFVSTYRVGIEQLIVFVTTIIATLATDLLIGIASGIAMKFIIHLINGVPIRSLFWPHVEVIPEDDTTNRLVASHSAVFSNWIPFRRQILNAGIAQRKNLIVDLAGTRLVDHTVMERLHEMTADFVREGLRLEVVGLDNHLPMSSHPFCARKRSRHAVPTVSDAARSL